MLSPVQMDRDPAEAKGIKRFPRPRALVDSGRGSLCRTGIDSLPRIGGER
jgi:hypothetical protein